MNGSECHCRDSFATHLSIQYGKSLHVYFALVVCLFGTISNLLNVAVLTRKEMVCAPINRILTALAVADMFIMVEYIPFAYYYYVELPGKLNFPHWGAVYMLIHMHFTQILHTISVCLTLFLAIWRYLAIGFPDRNRTLCSENRCTLGITLSFILPLILCIPTYLTFTIESTVVTEDRDYILYHVALSEFGKEHDFFLVHIWLYAVIIKLLPCCILTIISSWLIRTLFEAQKRKRALKNWNDSTKKMERRADRTTKMLVLVLVLFLATEFPQGLFGLIISLKGTCMFIQCYQDYGEVMDILALFNGSVNFILYCWMNRMFRMQFALFFRAKKSKILGKLTVQHLSPSTLQTNPANSEHFESNLTTTCV